MIVEKQNSYSGVRRLSKIALVVLLPLVLLLTISWFVLRSDHAFVIRKVQETALEYFDINLQLEGYRLEWTRPYPLIRFQVHGLKIASTLYPNQPILRVNSATSEFNPWDLVTGNFQAHPFQIDSAWIHLYTDSLEQQQDADEEPEKTGGPDVDLSQLPAISVNYLDFHREDDYRHKWQWAKFSGLQLVSKPNEAGDWSLHLRSDCFFEGLVFKAADGGFLMNTPAELALQIALTDEGQTLILQPSTLRVKQNEFHLRGEYEWADPNRIQLEISTDAITMADALPLLSDKVNNALCDIQIDQPIRTEFSLNNLIIPNRKEAILVDFSTENAAVMYKDVSMTSTKLSGSFSSDCDEDGMGDPVTSCITIHQLAGDFFGVLPASLEGLITNMEDPHVNASGRMDIELPRLNPLLTEKGKATFAEGRATVNFLYDGELVSVLSAPFDNQNIQVQGDATFDGITLATADRNITSPSLSGYLSFNEHQTLLEDIDLKWMGTNIQLSGYVSNLPEFFFYDDQTIGSNISLHFDHLDLNQLKPDKEITTSNKQEKKIDDRRLEELARQLANNVNGQMQIRIDKLIYDTLFLTDLNTTLRLFTLRRIDFADSAMIRIDSLSANFMGTTPMYAHLNISRESVPEVLADIHLPSFLRVADSFLPQKISLNKGVAKLDLSAWMPLRSFTSIGSWPSNLSYQGLLHLERVEVEYDGWQQPVSEISGLITFDQEEILLDNLQFQYHGSPYFLSGQIGQYAAVGKKANEKAIVDLRLNGKQLDLRKKKYQGDEPQDETTTSPAELFRSLKPVFQQATGKLAIGLESLLTTDRNIHPFLLEAQLLSDDTQPDQYQLKVDSFNLGFGRDNYFKGSALIKNPDRPTVEAQVKAHLQFDQLGKLLPSEYLEMRKGNFEMDLHYHSPLYDTLDAKNYLLNANINGSAKLTDGEIFYNYRDFTFSNIFGHLQFDQKTLYIRNLDLEVNGNRLIASGQSNDFFSFFVLPDRRAQIELAVTSPHFDFDAFTAPHGLGKDTLNLRKVRKLLNTQMNGVGATDTTSALQQTAGYIDQLLDRGSIDMSTNFKEVIYENFTARQVDGRISLAPDTVQLHNLRMDVANGKFSIAGLISDIVRHEPKIEVSLQMDKNNVREIFRQFDDFGQQDLGYKNMEGLISAELHFKADVNSNYSILTETMEGDMGVKLAGGELIDVGVFDKLSGFLFRNRGMDHILLDTLDLFSHIRGSDLYLDNFHLHSSSFDFGALGRYSLGADKKTRILFSIPIHNLFKRHISREEMRSGDSERKGINILIEARYKKDRMHFIWKPFVFSKKKYRMVE